MKKLLLSLGAVGLGTTIPMSVIACSPNEQLVIQEPEKEKEKPTDSFFTVEGLESIIYGSSNPTHAPKPSKYNLNWNYISIIKYNNNYKNIGDWYKDGNYNSSFDWYCSFRMITGTESTNVYINLDNFNLIPNIGGIK